MVVSVVAEVKTNQMVGEKSQRVPLRERNGCEPQDKDHATTAEVLQQSVEYQPYN